MAQLVQFRASAACRQVVSRIHGQITRQASSLVTMGTMEVPSSTWTEGTIMAKEIRMFTNGKVGSENRGFR